MESTSTNIPKSNVINVISEALRTIPESDEINQKWIIHIEDSDRSKLIQFDQRYYKQPQELAMGARHRQYWQKRTSYTKHVEHKQIGPVLTKNEIIGCFRHVDDIFKFFDQRNN
jgi:hypothetical protein